MTDNQKGSNSEKQGGIPPMKAPMKAPVDEDVGTAMDPEINLRQGMEKKTPETRDDAVKGERPLEE